MADAQKRNTLKYLGISGLGLGIGAFSTAPLAVNEHRRNSEPTGAGDLSIQVFCTSAVQENTVTLVNHTDKSLVLSEFIPNVVIFNNKLVDLNSLISDHQVIEIGSGEAFASEIEIWQVLAQPVMEYVWAEHAIKQLTDQTSVVSLAATLVKQKIIVYADPNGVSLVT